MFTMYNFIVIPFIRNSLVCVCMSISLNVIRNGIERSCFVCLLAWYCMYSSAVIGIGLMCCLLHVIILPMLLTCILYDLLWWLWLSLPIIVPQVHGPQSSHWTATVDPIGIDIKIFEVLLLLSFCPCLCIKFLWYSSSLPILISFLSITGIMPCTGQLNSNVAGLAPVVWS